MFSKTRTLTCATANALMMLAATGLTGNALAQCPPTFSATTYGMAGTPIQTVVGDFNHDGKLDLASPNFSGSNITVRFANASQPAGTNYDAAVALPVGLNPSSMAAADFNADGVTDLAVGYINGGAARIGVFISNGDRTFQPIVNYAPSPTSTQVKAFDINRDGIMDIVALAVGNLLVLPGHAGAWTAGGAEAFSVRPVNSGSGSYFTLADTNSDGALDLLTCQTDPGRLNLSLGSAPTSNSFGTSAAYGSGYFGTNSPAAGDFNRDGVLDIVVGHQVTTSRIQVFLGNTGGTLTPLAAVVPGNAAPKSLVVADFNGDGLLDAACVHNGGVGVHLGDGTGGLGPFTNYTVSSATSMATADMNNDGRPDLIVGSQTTGGFTVLLNTTPVTTFQTAPVSARTCPGGAGSVQFTAAATTTQAGGISGYAWQRLNGTVWTTLANGPLAGVGTISGATTQVLTISNVQGAAGAFVTWVRAVANTSCGGNPSVAASLELVAPCGPADLGGTGGVPTPCGGDGVLDNNDFVVFIDYFFNGNVLADVGSVGGLPGGDGRFDNNDFVVFIDMFFTGCGL